MSSKKPTLVVLAAGMGSRYGGLKQVDGFGPNGETITDYTLYDAIRVGFKKVVFVIRKSFAEQFQKSFDEKLAGKIEVAYVYQELGALPEGWSVPEGREKPWGTGHAVMVAKDAVEGPFAIVNADDFYGQNSLQLILNQLLNLDEQSIAACMVGFVLEKTLSDHGRVSRGICTINEGHLERIVERTHIFSKPGGGAYYVENDENHDLTGKEIVSMNLMGFTPAAFKLMDSMFAAFLEHQGAELKSEFYIPSVLDEIRRNHADVPVGMSEDQWFGVTYAEDKAVVETKLKELTADGAYPKNLW